jgi:hypothetical protein
MIVMIFGFPESMSAANSDVETISSMFKAERPSRFDEERAPTPDYDAFSSRRVTPMDLHLLFIGKAAQRKPLWVWEPHHTGRAYCIVAFIVARSWVKMQ